MKILIGILYCIENEFKECIKSIQEQTYKNHDYFVLRDLPKKIAADQIYKNFMANKNDYDLFVKLDADMVIEDSGFLGIVKEFFNKQPRVNLLSLPVYDHFTETLIPAVNIYRSCVKFPLRHDGLFTDPNPVLPEKCVFGLDYLNGSVSHCKNPSMFQAFHFGMHRCMKIVHGDISTLWDRVSLQSVSHERVWKNFLKTKKKSQGFASLGGEITLNDHFEPDHLNYSNIYAKSVFSEFENCSEEDLKRIIKKLRLKSWGCMPWWFRLGMVNKTDNMRWAVIFKHGAGKVKRLLNFENIT